MGMALYKGVTKSKSMCLYMLNVISSFISAYYENIRIIFVRVVIVLIRIFVYNKIICDNS